MKYQTPQPCLVSLPSNSSLDRAAEVGLPSLEGAGSPLLPSLPRPGSQMHWVNQLLSHERCSITLIARGKRFFSSPPLGKHQVTLFTDVAATTEFLESA